MKDENPKEIVADSKVLSEQILGKVREENSNYETSYKNVNVTNEGPNAEKRLKQIPITNFFKQSQKDLPKLDEKLVKTNLKVQPKETLDKHSPILVDGNAGKALGKVRKRIKKRPAEERHLPWQISSNIEAN